MKIEEIKQDGFLVVKFTGVFDEDVVFKEIQEAPIVHFDFEGVKAINSCGIREWIKWMATLQNRASLHFVRCPKIIVDQINMVEGFLPKNGQVVSFYVPYFCEDTGEEKNFLFEKGVQFGDGKLKVEDEIQDAGKVFELDVIASKYFKFLSV